jgi:hypothetical protein
MKNVRSFFKWSSWLMMACLMLALSSSAYGQARSVNLAEMVKYSATIVVGKVTDVREGRHSQYQNIAVTYVTVKVETALRGTPSQSFTFMQYGGIKSRSIADAPTYRTNEEILLFLYPESKVGFTSPVGGGQGKFLIARDSKGERIIVNELNNRALLKEMLPRIKPTAANRELLNSQGPLPLGAFLALVQELLH